MISFIYPHKDRSDLFLVNLESLLRQSDIDFEIVTIDNSDNPGGWVAAVEEYRKKGLRIKAAIVDPTRSPFFKRRYDGHVNPSAIQNFAFKMCEGDVIVLSSPEVINATTNVQKIREYFKNPEHVNHFLYGWLDERPKEMVASEVEKGISVSTIKSICKENLSKRSARCRHEDFQAYQYYLGAMKRSNFALLGGIDEKYMAGVGWEDIDFGRRVQLIGMKCVLNDSVAGIHLAHDRSYSKDSNQFVNQEYYKTFNPQRDVVANRGFEWGSSCMLVKVI
jgi:hypothetical protein